MKKISLYIASVMLGACGLLSCSDNWETPPAFYPTEAGDIEATITIADLKATYWDSSTDYVSTVGTTANGKNTIIKGTVTSSTVENNIYKTVYIQDSTSAICLGLDTNAVYSVMPMGVEVALNLTGMSIGRFKGLMQIGKDNNGKMGRVAYRNIERRLSVDFMGGQLDTTATTLSELLASSKTTTGQIYWESRLVRINGVKFMEAGEDFSEEGESTSRTITDGKGNYLTVRNSNSADFAYQPLPYGTGDIVGILSYYNGWQLLLNDENGCIDFDGEGAPDDDIPEPERPEGVLSVEEAYAIIAANEIPDHTVQVMGRITSINAADFQPSYGNLTYTLKDKNGKKGLEVYRGYWLNGAKFTSASQIQIGQYIIVEGTLVNYNGKYEFTNGSKVITYFGDIVDTPDTPGTDEPGTDEPDESVTVFSETFAGGIGDFTIENAVMPEGVTYIWQHDSSYKCMKASAYVSGTRYVTDSWLISPVIDLSATTAAALSFEQAVNYLDNAAKKMLSVNVRPEGGEWTEVTVPTWPAGSNWTFGPSGKIDLSAFAGKKVQIGFRYTSSATDAATWEVKHVKVESN